jgi:hypothetical protein
MVLKSDGQSEPEGKGNKLAASTQPAIAVGFSVNEI